MTYSQTYFCQCGQCNAVWTAHCGRCGLPNPAPSPGEPPNNTPKPNEGESV